MNSAPPPPPSTHEVLEGGAVVGDEVVNNTFSWPDCSCTLPLHLAHTHVNPRPHPTPITHNMYLCSLKVVWSWVRRLSTDTFQLTRLQLHLSPPPQLAHTYVTPPPPTNTTHIHNTYSWGPWRWCGHGWGGCPPPPSSWPDCSCITPPNPHLAHTHVNPSHHPQQMHTHEVLEGGAVVGEEVVHHHLPADQTAGVHHEEVGVQQQLQALLAPRLAWVLVPAHTAQQLWARTEAWHVVRAGTQPPYIGVVRQKQSGTKNLPSYAL